MKKMKRMTQRDFKLLLSFLTEDNSGTLIMVKNQIQAALKRNPKFRALVEALPDPRIRAHAEMFLEELRFKEMEPAFEKLLRQGKNLDLERGVTLLAKIDSPQLKIKQVSEPLDKIAEKVDRIMASQPPLPTRAVTAMRKTLFEIEKFHGDENHYYDTDNIFIHKVLKRKKGIPISLSCVYLFVAWRLKLLVHGIGLPGHFIVGHRVPRGVVHIDPFQNGKVLRSKDCEMLVRRLGLPFKQSYLDPSTNIQIFSRLVVSLINTYNDQGLTLRAQWLARLFGTIVA